MSDIQERFDPDVYEKAVKTAMDLHLEIEDGDETKAWDLVALYQSMAWKRLAEVDPNYQSKDVEDTFDWQYARMLAGQIIKHRAN